MASAKSSSLEPYVSHPLRAALDALDRVLHYSTAAIFKLVGLTLLACALLIGVIVGSGALSHYHQPLLGISLSLAAGLAFAIFILIVLVAQVRVLTDAMSRKNTALRPLLSLGSRKLLPMIGLLFLYALMIIGGFILLIVPGIYLALRFSFAPFILVNEDSGVMDALRRSWSLTHGHLWEILGAYAAPQVLVSIITLVLGWLAYGIIVSGAPVVAVAIGAGILLLGWFVVSVILSIGGNAAVAYRYHQIGSYTAQKATTPKTNPANYAVAALAIILNFLPSPITAIQNHWKRGSLDTLPGSSIEQPPQINTYYPY